MRYWRFGLVCFLFLLRLEAAYSESLTEATLDKSVARAMQDFSTPGLAIAVVYGDTIAFSKGYGLRQAGQPEEVDDGTLFQVGSITKAFTSTALGMLVDQGRLAWDDPVIDHFPEFRLSDPYMSSEVRVRDMLAHNSGLAQGAGDLLFWPNARGTRQDVISALRYLKVDGGVRTGFRYNNLMYVVAAELIDAISGESWEDFVEQRIFTPLQMHDCAATYERSRSYDNHATPHMSVDGKPVPTFFSPGAVMSSAGAINCSARDFVRWMQELVRQRQSGADAVVSAEVLHAAWAPANLLGPDRLLLDHADSHFRHYGLGWFVGDYKDDWIVEHGGTIHGATARIILVPERSFGVAVFANDSSAISRALALDVVDTLLYDGATDWLSIYSPTDRKAGTPTPKATGTVRKTGKCPDPVAPGDSIVFFDRWYGNATVRRDKDSLVLDLERTPSLIGPLQCVSGDVYVVHWTDRTLHADSYVQFQRNLEGDVDSMRLEWLDPHTDFSYDFQDLNFRVVRSEVTQ